MNVPVTSVAIIVAPLGSAAQQAGAAARRSCPSPKGRGTQHDDDGDDRGARASVAQLETDAERKVSCGNFRRRLRRRSSPATRVLGPKSPAAPAPARFACAGQPRSKPGTIPVPRAILGRGNGGRRWRRRGAFRPGACRQPPQFEVGVSTGPDASTGSRSAAQTSMDWISVAAVDTCRPCSFSLL